MDLISIIEYKQYMQCRVKTFVFQNQSSKSSQIYSRQISWQSSAASVNLSQLLEQFLALDRHLIWLYDPDSKGFERCMGSEVPVRYLSPAVIMVRFREVEEKADRKDRSRQRTIGEVIEVVRKWRLLHIDPEGPRLNLQEAAKVVGVSKKSLDDYFFQLRLGEYHNFLFYDNLNEKIAVLRNFVKRFKPPKENFKNNRHPKQLKIILATTQTIGINALYKYQLQNQHKQKPIKNTLHKSIQHPLLKQKHKSQNDEKEEEKDKSQEQEKEEERSLLRLEEEQSQKKSSVEYSQEKKRDYLEQFDRQFEFEWDNRDPFIPTHLINMNWDISNEDSSSFH